MRQAVALLFFLFLAAAFQFSCADRGANTVQNAPTAPVVDVAVSPAPGGSPGAVVYVLKFGDWGGNGVSMNVTGRDEAIDFLDCNAVSHGYIDHPIVLESDGGFAADGFFWPEPAQGAAPQKYTAHFKGSLVNHVLTLSVLVDGLGTPDRVYKLKYGGTVKRMCAEMVRPGSWGSQTAELDVNETGQADVKFQCNAGRIDEPLILDGNHHFRVNGSWIKKAGPIVVGEDPNHPAVYEGTVTGDTMDFHVRYEYHGTHDENYTLHHGTAITRVGPCPL